MVAHEINQEEDVNWITRKGLMKLVNLFLCVRARMRRTLMLLITATEDFK